MSWRSSEMMGYGIETTDGSIGSIHDLLFDDMTWTLRWAVIDTGNWLPGRRVPLPPSAMGPPNLAGRTFPLDLTREQVKSSPEYDPSGPIYHHYEEQLHAHYGYGVYWGVGVP